jgi:hypothetical protein
MESNREFVSTWVKTAMKNYRQAENIYGITPEASSILDYNNIGRKDKEREANYQEHFNRAV